MGKMYHKSSNSVMTPGFSCVGINSKDSGRGECSFFEVLNLLGFFLSCIGYFQWCGFSQTASMRNMIHWVIYDILRDVLWTTSFPVCEEGQAGCGHVLEALAFVSVSQFGSVSHLCV